MAEKKEQVMLTWVSLVHAGSWLPAALSQHLHDKIGISLAEQDLMKQLGAAGGELKLVDLSRRIFLSKAGVSKMVDRLQAAGLVVRERSNVDRRVVNARLTATGTRKLQKSKKLLVDWVQTNLGDHLTTSELTNLQSALRVVLDRHGRWEGQQAHLRGEET